MDPWQFKCKMVRDGIYICISIVKIEERGMDEQRRKNKRERGWGGEPDQGTCRVYSDVGEFDLCIYIHISIDVFTYWMTGSHPKMMRHNANGYFLTKVCELETLHMDTMAQLEHSAKEAILARTTSLTSETFGISLIKGKIIEHANELITCGNTQYPASDKYDIHDIGS